MLVGDLVAKNRSPEKALGVITRLFQIHNRLMHEEPLPMAEIMTKDGLAVWKQRKLRVINECG